MARTVEIAGSWGRLSVHAATGLVLAYEDEGNTPDPGDGPDWGYHHIARFDPADIAREGGEGGDVLAFGYWTKAGDYAEPLVPGFVPDPYSRQPGEMMLSEWVPLRLLPAPSGEAATRARLEALGFREGFHVMELLHPSGWFVWATAADGGSTLDETDFCLGLYPPGSDCAEDSVLMFWSETEGDPPFSVALSRVLARFTKETGDAPGKGA